MDTTFPDPLAALPPDRPYYSPALAAAQAASARRRGAAMCLPQDTVAGLVLRPLTPATYSRLVALGSPFLWGAAARSGDVRNYIWLHSPDFTTDPRGAARAQRRVFARLERHLAPPWRRWRYSRAAWQNLIAAGYACAAAEIAELFEIAFADAPPPGSGKGPAIGATLEAQFIDTFAGAYATWPLPQPVSETPLRQLYQFLRCINGGDYDATEAAIIAADLELENRAALAAAKN